MGKAGKRLTIFFALALCFCMLGTVTFAESGMNYAGGKSGARQAEALTASAPAAYGTNLPENDAAPEAENGAAGLETTLDDEEVPLSAAPPALTYGVNAPIHGTALSAKPEKTAPVAELADEAVPLANTPGTSSRSLPLFMVMAAVVTLTAFTLVTMRFFKKRKESKAART